MTERKKQRKERERQRLIVRLCACESRATKGSAWHRGKADALRIEMQYKGYYNA